MISRRIDEADGSPDPRSRRAGPLGAAREPAEPIPDPIPEADDDSVQRAWDKDEAMEGPAPTG